MSLEQVVEPSVHLPGREDPPENDLCPRSCSVEPDPCSVTRIFAISMDRRTWLRNLGVEARKGDERDGGNEWREAPGY